MKSLNKTLIKLITRNSNPIYGTEVPHLYLRLRGSDEDEQAAAGGLKAGQSNSKDAAPGGSPDLLGGFDAGPSGFDDFNPNGNGNSGGGFDDFGFGGPVT